MKKKSIFQYLVGLLMLSGCTESFLDTKPSTAIILPQSLTDFSNLLDNTTKLNYTSGLGQMAADEYEFINYESWQGTFTATERNSYIWAKDIFEGEIKRNDWNDPYLSISYANNTLEGLKKLQSPPSVEYNQIKGWALFIRAFSHYDLVRTFSLAYDPNTSATDLGIPLRLKPEIDVLTQRASVKDSYEQVISDLEQSCFLLSPQFQQNNRNRPSKTTAYAMLSRVYLSMNKYEEAELYADSSLLLYNKLIDYNTISSTSATPFSLTNDETLFSTSQVIAYNITTNATFNTAITINPKLIDLYEQDDLRLSTFFGKNALGNYYAKRGYNAIGNYPFTGLAVNELYLIKAECLARRNKINDAMKWLNDLLIKRYSNTVQYIPVAVSTQNEAINKILQERQKELVWRGIRWSDIKRLNKIGANITLKRVLNGKEYILPPNDARYAFPIPDDEIAHSRIEQTPR